MIGDLKFLFSRLSKADRARFAAIVGALALSAMMEMVGIGAMLPLISLIQAPNGHSTGGAVNLLVRLLGLDEGRSLLPILLGFLVVFFIFKNAFQIQLDRWQYRFMARLQSELAARLMRSYLNREYLFHVHANTSRLVRNATVECQSVFYFVMVPMVTVAAESLVLLGLLCLVVALDPTVAVGALVLGTLLVGTFYWTFRGRMHRIGTQLQATSGRMIQIANEGLGGIKEVRVMGTEEFFATAFGMEARINSRELGRALALHNLPIHALESFFVVIFVAVIYWIEGHSDPARTFPMLGVYAAAAFRVMPSLSRLVTANNRLRQGTASLHAVAADLREPGVDRPSRDTPEALPFERDLVVAGVQFAYPDAPAPALRGIDLRIGRGEMVGFTGRSGSGKTTLVDCIIGLLAPDHGQILVDGVDTRSRLHDWQAQIGYIAQHIFLTDDTLRRNIALGTNDSRIDESMIWKSLADAQLLDFVRTLPEGLETRVGERGVRLSGGQRQRIGIARALYRNPAVLVLDEATSALDVETERAVVETIRGLRGSKTILVIAHRQSALDHCDRIYHLAEGQLS